MRCIIVALSLLIFVKSSAADCNKGNGGCEQVCAMENGLVKCSCMPSFELNHDNITCHSTDLCRFNNGGCDQNCTSDHANGKVTCVCASNYELDKVGGKTCKYRNLCLESGNKGGCQHNCNSIEGKEMVCSCRTGFALDDDKKSCYDKNGCKVNNGGCEHKCTPKGKKVECSCFVGFTKDKTNSSKCASIKPFVAGVKKFLLASEDECEDNNGGCSHYCKNTIESYECSCPDDYELGSDGKTCETWNWYYTLIIILVIFAILILFITICCLCGKFKWLQENICCKCFCSWKCCMTGLFCKCNKRSEADVTDLYYHQVKLQITPIKDGRLWISGKGHHDDL